MKIDCKSMLCTFVALSFGLAKASTDIEISSLVWDGFSPDEKLEISSKFKGIKIRASGSIGVIQGVQVVNKSTDGTSGGAVLGSAIAQAVYVDKAFRGSGNGYSAKSHLGVALLGGIIGSNLDSRPESRFILNYSIKTLDGQIRQLKVDSSDEFARPIGQCIQFPDLDVLDAFLCSDSKLSTLTRLSVIGGAPPDAVVGREISGVVVKCLIRNVGMMMLEKSACVQMEGSIEK